MVSLELRQANPKPPTIISELAETAKVLTVEIFSFQELGRDTIKVIPAQFPIGDTSTERLHRNVLAADATFFDNEGDAARWERVVGIYSFNEAFAVYQAYELVALNL